MLVQYSSGTKYTCNDLKSAVLSFLLCSFFSVKKNGHVVRERPIETQQSG